jgi:signal transduction histidine kinase
VWLTVCTTAVFLDGGQPLRYGLSPVAADAIAVAFLTIAVAISRRLPVVAAAMPAALTFAMYPDLYYENLLVAQVVLAFLLGRRSRRTGTGLLLWVGICVSALLAAAIAPDTAWVDGQRACTSTVLVVLLPWLVGRYLRQRDELIRTGWELADRMKHERDLAGQRARMRERTRIASDIHDSVGHELSLIALRAAAIEVDSAAGAAARRAAAELRQAAAHATTRLHDVLGVLREESDAIPVLPTDDTVAALLERAKASGLQITVTGDLPELSPPVARAAYRVVQEALTNAVKHAPGAPVTVNLGSRPRDGQAHITVVNAVANGHRSSDQHGGFGLVSLDERVRTAGGQLVVRRTGERFRVTARLPLAECHGS